MKKITIVFLSIFTMLLTSVLVGCNFKDVKANFNENKISFSLSESKKIDLKDYLDVSGIDINEVSFELEDSSIFYIDGSVITPMNYGKSKVYATYQKNCLAAMDLIVKQPLTTPFNLRVIENDGKTFLTWNKIYANNENGEIVPAQKYEIKGERVVYSKEDPEEVVIDEEISEKELNDNLYELEEGMYALQVRALGFDDFDDSEYSEENVYYAGYMPELGISSFLWTPSGKLSWTMPSDFDIAPENIRYQVKIDNNLGEIISENTTDLSDYFDREDVLAGEHKISVIVLDVSKNENARFPRESETLVINKLDTPEVSVKDGKLYIARNENTQKYKVSYTSQESDENEIVFENLDEQSEFSTDFSGVESGIYDVKIIAYSEGFFYQNTLDFGKIYKFPKVVITGAGEKDETHLKLNFSSEEYIADTNFKIFKTINDNTDENVVSGFTDGKTNMEIDTELLMSGQYLISAEILPVVNQANINDFQDVYLIKSDVCDQVNAIKLADFDSFLNGQKIEHKYVGENSVFTFSKIDFATDYEIYCEEDLIGTVTPEDDSSEITFIFSGHIEDLKPMKDKYSFKVKAKRKVEAEEDLLSIGSYATKELTVLKTEQGEPLPRDNSSEIFSWEIVENADEYKLEFYKLTSSEFDLSSSEGIFTKTVENVSLNSYNCSELGVGYYLIKVYAVKQNDNSDFYLSSNSPYQEKFYISKQLQFGEVKFGYNADYMNERGANGYFLNVNKVEDADKYILNSVFGEEENTYNFTNSDIENGRYNLLHTFNQAGDTTLTLKAINSVDSRLYLDSDEVKLIIHKFDTIKYLPSDVERSDIYFDKNTERVYVKSVENARQIIATLTANEYVYSSESSEGKGLDISVPRELGCTNMPLKINLIGSLEQKVERDTFFVPDDSGVIYLGSETNFTINRVTTPTEFKYKDGKLSFINTEKANTQFYVLNFTGTTLNDQIVTISVRFESLHIKIYVTIKESGNVIQENLIETETTEEELSNRYFPQEGNEGTNVTIDYEQLTNLLRTKYEAVYTPYSQMANVVFDVFAYKEQVDANIITLSSPNAIVYGKEGLKESLTVRKMTKTTLSFESGLDSEDMFIGLKWEYVQAPDENNVDTKYVILCNDEEYVNIDYETFSHNIPKTYFSEFQKEYSIRVLVKNPYYLESELSNEVKIFRLRGVQKIGVKDGELIYQVLSGDEGKYDNVIVEYNEESAVDENGKIKIKGEGVYSFELAGKHDEVSDIYYISSPITNWNLKKIDTLAPKDTNMNLSTSEISWNPLNDDNGAVGFDNLVYELIFKDSAGGTLVYKNSVNPGQAYVNVFTTLANEVAGLKEGDLDVQLVAYFENKYYSTNEVIYFSESQTLLNDKEGFNYYIYLQNSDQNSRKLIKQKTPEITSIEANLSSPDKYYEAQEVGIIISFKGNYGESAVFDVRFKDDDEVNRVTLHGVSSEDGYIYKYEDFDARALARITENKNGTIIIQALSDTAEKLPSATVEQEILRASALKNLSFEDENGKLGQTLKISLPEIGRVNGGVVLKIDYQSGGDSSTIYNLVTSRSEDSDLWEYELLFEGENFFEKKMSNGGSFTISGFVNFFGFDGENKICILPSSSIPLREQTYKILKKVEQSQIDQTPSNGFSIRNGQEINDENTIYIVEYFETQSDGNSVASFQELSKENNYQFEIPNLWGNNLAGYPVTIYAIEDGYIPSAKLNLSISITRLNKIAGVSIERQKNDYNISWTKNDENAEGYAVNVYGIDSERPQLFFNKELGSGTSFKLTDLFGQDYSGLLEYLNVDNFQQNEINLRLGLVATSSLYKNSSECLFDVKILKQVLTDENLIVDEHGLINFIVPEDYPESEFLYKYEYIATNPETSLVPADWSKLTQKIDTTNLDEKLVSFRVEIVNVGKLKENQVTNYDGTPFEIVSKMFVSNAFIFSYKINSVSISTIDASTLEFTMDGVGPYAVLAGLHDGSEDGQQSSLLTGKVVGVDLEPGEEDIFSCNLPNLLSKLEIIEGSVLKGETNIYFWSYSTQNESEIGAISVVSKPYKGFQMNFGGELSGSIVKESLDESKEFEGINTFALFDNNGENDVEAQPNILTLGFNVRISSRERELSVLFVSKKQTLINDYYGDLDIDSKNYFAINITELFELLDSLYIDEEVLLSGENEFKIEFSKMTRTKNGESFSYSYSDWWTAEQDGNEYAFSRLQTVENVRLSKGNLIWNANTDNCKSYRVYFITSFDNTTPKNYTTYETKYNYFYASRYAGANGVYRLAVQGIDKDDAYVISSKRSYVMNVKNNEIAEIVKNQISTDLKLKNGVLAANWDGSDFIAKILQQGGGMSTENLVTSIYNTTFTIPFTFKLSDIVDDKLIMRFEFLSIAGGNPITFDINANLLLSNIFNIEKGSEIKDKFNDFLNNLPDNNRVVIRDAINKFINKMEGSSSGIGSAQLLFDDYFERLQPGGYTMRYCLLGGDDTLTSGWWSFSNGIGDENPLDNLIYVNTQPDVNAKIISETNSLNSYKVIFQKSLIYKYDGNAISNSNNFADNYVMRIGKNRFAFEIVKGSNNYSMRLVSYKDKDGNNMTIPESKNISVSECDADGNRGGTSHLMFYLNLNGGDSLLGQYGDIIGVNSFEMQIAAAGSDVSMSSKSEYFTVNFLGFDESLSIVDGTFVWTPTDRRITSVIYQKYRSHDTEVQVSADLTTGKANFSLVGLGAGYYNYIQFVVKGNIRYSDNTINVDSAVYQIDNVFKLWSPTLSNEFGLLKYDASSNVDNNEPKDIRQAYTDGDNIYSYILYNNVSVDPENNKDDYAQITDNRAAELRGTPNTYELGTTNMISTDVEGDIEGDVGIEYKSSEVHASKFYMYMLGSNAKFTYESNPSSSEYYLKKIKFGGENNDKTVIAVRSDAGSAEKENNIGYIEGAMLDMVDAPEVSGGLDIVGGNLVWNPVNKRTETNQIPDETAKIVYKIIVNQYKGSWDGNDFLNTNVCEPQVFYTTKTNFDFTKVTKPENVENYDEIKLRVVVQALALYVSPAPPSARNYIQLVDNEGYAFGSPLYQSDNPNSYVFMSDGRELLDITRLKEIDEGSLRVQNGFITWDYSVTGVVVDSDNFSDYFDFVVTDENENEIEGDYEIIGQTGNKFTIKFKDKGMSSGKVNIKVYVTQGTNNVENIIKSYASSLKEVEKLPTVSDYKLNSQTTYETLDLSPYFESRDDYQNLIISLKLSSQEQEIKFGMNGNKLLSKMLILTSIPSEDFIYPEDFDEYVTVTVVNGEEIKYLIVDDETQITMTFSVEINDGTKITSNESEEFKLARENWHSEEPITWNETKGQFEWDFNAYHFNQKISVQEIEIGYILNGRTAYYTASNCANSSLDDYLEKGERIYIKNVEGNITEIFFDDETKKSVSNSETTRFIYTKFYDQSWIDVQNLAGENVTQEFDEEETFRIIEENVDYVVIELNGKNYRANDSIIKRPIFIVEAKYSNGKTIIYNIQKEKIFRPTVVGNVDVNIRIKLDENSIQSSAKTYSGNFNLFASGEGTEISPYLITNVTEFKNIAFRMKKDYNTYILSSGEETTDSDTRLHFQINGDIDLTNGDTEKIAGILFKGQFDGVINGAYGEKNSVIKYTSNGIVPLTENITINDNDTMVYITNPHSNLIFMHGSSLFEKVTGTIKNLDIDANFLLDDVSPDSFPMYHGMMAGLVIANKGTIENVNLIGFSTNLIGRAQSGLTIMAYGGIVGENRGDKASIRNCHLKTDMNFIDAGYELSVFVGGIAIVNYQMISECSVALKGVDDYYSISITETNASSNLQIGGIVMANSRIDTTPIIQKCVNNGNMILNPTSDTEIDGYISGIVVSGQGTVEECSYPNNTERIQVNGTYTQVKTNAINSYTKI